MIGATHLCLQYFFKGPSLVNLNPIPKFHDIIAAINFYLSFANLYKLEHTFST